MPSWKTAQSKRKNDKKIKLALIVLGAVLALIFLSQAFKFTRTLFGQKQHFWNGDFNINLILKADPVSLLIYSPKDERVTVIDIPNQTYLEAAHQFGKWQLGSIYGVGGEDLLKASAGSFFGLPIDGFLENTSLKALTEKNPFSIFNVLSSIKTDLTPFELVKLKMGLSQVRFDKIKKIDLLDQGFLQKAKLADGTEILDIDPLSLDSLSGEFIDPTIKSEGKTVAIFNCTDHPGLAQKAARLVANTGADVIIVSNGEKRIEKSVVLGDKSQTLIRLKQIFGSNGKIEPDLENLVSSRAQINLFLGEDYFKSL